MAIFFKRHTFNIINIFECVSGKLNVLISAIKEEHQFVKAKLNSVRSGVLSLKTETLKCFFKESKSAIGYQSVPKKERKPSYLQRQNILFTFQYKSSY